MAKLSQEFVSESAAFELSAGEPSGKERRIHISLSPEAQKRLADLVKATEAASTAEVIRNAIRLYEYFLQVKIEGEDIYTRTPDGELKKLVIFT